MMNPKIAITMGDPAGIGPEIIIKAINSINNFEKYLLIGSKEIFHEAACKLNQPLSEKLEILDIPCDISRIKTGESSFESGRSSFLALEKACRLAKDGRIRAIVTAPLSKKAINMAGYNYSGQTEILQEYLGDSGTKAEMLFVAGNFRVMLLTRHVAIENVPKSLNIDKIVYSLCSLDKFLRKNLKIKNLRIAVCGLNPHAGEDGLLGAEEDKIISPALDRLRSEFNIQAEGPFPADTLWTKAVKPYQDNIPQPYDCYVACYHDQGLIPVKLLAMDSVVNTTINLSVIRTSPGHGTAYDIAGMNIANHKSMKEAIKLVSDLSE